VVNTRSNNWYQSQGHEFYSQWGNCLGGDCCKLHNYPVVEVRWVESQSKSLIPSRIIAEGEIVASGINCPVAEGTWAKSKSNRDTWAATLLNRKSWVLTNGYNFWSSGKRSIQQSY